MKLRTAVNQNGDILPVFRLVSAQGRRLAVPPTGTISTPPLPAGVYLLNATVNVFMNLGPGTSAGEVSGSFVFPAGASAYFRLNQGDRVTVRAVSEAGSVFAIPAEEA
jgi:hypothetical protein